MQPTTTRDRAAVLTDLADARHRAGRMTCVDANYRPVHERINALLTELETCPPRQHDDSQGPTLPASGQHTA